MSQAEVGKPSYNGIGREVDLRELVLAILSRWKLISAVVVLTAIAVTVINNHVLTPWYRSSSVLYFPGADQISDLSFEGFQALASSPSVMAQVVRDTGLSISVNELIERFAFEAAPDSPLLRASVHANDPNLARRIIEAWIVAVRAETFRFMEVRLADRKALAETNYIETLQAMLEAEEALARFDSEHVLEMLETELERDIARLVDDERTLENLKGSVIPADEATVRVLNELLAGEDAIIDGGLGARTRFTGELELTAVNPTYVEIRQRLTALEASLAANRRRVEALDASVPELRSRVEKTNSLLTDLKLQRERLRRQAADARSRFEAAQAELHEIFALERQLPLVSRVDVVADPLFSDQPVAPRKLFNLALGVTLALMISILGALVAEWWRMER